MPADPPNLPSHPADLSIGKFAAAPGVTRDSLRF
jgi:hypothetical protein